MTIKRRHKEIWFEQGFHILKTRGAADLTIQNLTQRLGKTKGAFYHHFKNRNDYSEQLLQFWEEKQTTLIIALSQQEDTFRGINDKLTKLSLENTDLGIEVAIRAWALRDPLARAFQERVDKIRLDFLNSVFALLTRDPDQVKTIALIRYCFFIGSHQIIPGMAPETYTRSLATLIEMIETHVEKNGAPLFKKEENP
ncbi:MAG: TetR/AcrR family transcriptional regulator [Desulfobacterales bacterium]|nr:TetR/AcrR family transcriptional regulator [Desulfobacterales bacterium]